MNFTGLYHKNIASTAFKGLTIHRPYSSAFANELNFIVRMPVRTRAGTRLAMKQKYRNNGASLVGADKLVRTTDKGQVFLAHVVHTFPWRLVRI